MKARYSYQVKIVSKSKNKPDNAKHGGSTLQWQREIDTRLHVYHHNYASKFDDNLLNNFISLKP
jgi:hypothetical protein